MPDGLPVESNLPTVARFNLLDQPGHHRWIAHLLYAPISLRAQMVLWGQKQPTEIIEELLPLHRSRITLRLPTPVKSVALAPSGEVLPFCQDGNVVTFEVAEFTGHQMVVLNRAD